MASETIASIRNTEKHYRFEEEAALDRMPQRTLLESRLAEGVREGLTLGELLELVSDTRAEMNAGAPL